MDGRGSNGGASDLCSCVDLSLPSVLTLSEHCSSHELVPILSASQLCGFKENSRPIVPRESLPLFLRGKSAVDCIANDLLVSFMVIAEVSCMIRRYWLFDCLAGLDLRTKHRKRSVVSEREGGNGRKLSPAFRSLCKEPRRGDLSPFELGPLRALFVLQIPDRSFAKAVMSLERSQEREMIYHWFIVDGGDLEDS